MPPAPAPPPRFYLAFENSLCPDYATEKLYRALAEHVVPVVLGGANYTALAPPRSLLRAADFASPALLARELVRLAGSEAEYLDYFWWKVSSCPPSPPCRSTTWCTG